MKLWIFDSIIIIISLLVLLSNKQNWINGMYGVMFITLLLNIVSIYYYEDKLKEIK